MCLQKISISTDSQFLNFLNNCEPDKLYPPLRLYEDENFVFVNGLDRNQASISKVGFQVEIDGILYTDKKEAIRQLLLDINKINNNITGDLHPINTVYVSDLSHLPPPSGIDIKLLDLYTYIFTTKVDLMGNRIIGGNRTTILGWSSENCGITSTGLPSSVALIKAISTLVLRHIELKGSGTCFNINCLPNIGGNAAFDWTGVNVVNFDNYGIIKNIDNFIFTKGVFSDGKDLVFDEQFDSVVFDTSLLTTNGNAGDLIKFESTAVSNRRIRFERCPVVISGSTKGINANVSMIIDPEGFILNEVTFSGGTEADRLPGINYLSNKSLILNCNGVVNSANICFYSMSNNATPTNIISSGSPVKIAGSTTPNSSNQKFDTTIPNRAQYKGAIDRFFTATATATVTSNSNNDQIGFYISVNGVVVNESEVYITTNNNFRAENISIQSPPIMLSTDDYIEVFVENNTDSSDVTVTFLNMLIKES